MRSSRLRKTKPQDDVNIKLLLYFQDRWQKEKTLVYKIFFLIKNKKDDEK